MTRATASNSISSMSASKEYWVIDGFQFRCDDYNISNHGEAGVGVVVSVGVGVRPTVGVITGTVNVPSSSPKSGSGRIKGLLPGRSNALIAGLSLSIYR